MHQHDGERLKGKGNKMKQDCYELTFKVTETLQNGNERTFKKTILSPIFRNDRHIPEQERVQKGIEVLKGLHYYNIEYLETKRKTLLWIE